MKSARHSQSTVHRSVFATINSSPEIGGQHEVSRPSQPKLPPSPVVSIPQPRQPDLEFPNDHHCDSSTRCIALLKSPLAPARGAVVAAAAAAEATVNGTVVALFPAVAPCRCPRLPQPFPPAPGVAEPTDAETGASDCSWPINCRAATPAAGQQLFLGELHGLCCCASGRPSRALAQTVADATANAVIAAVTAAIATAVPARTSASVGALGRRGSCPCGSSRQFGLGCRACGCAPAWALPRRRLRWQLILRQGL
mmetsp:Transcript_9638/g.29208  ORF Transcript_9638/g.29208 Transcript_9638/m.29208 type:complete len:254 (+) Transcript_9638:37-798(+)